MRRAEIVEALGTTGNATSQALKKLSLAGLVEKGKRHGTYRLANVESTTDSDSPATLALRTHESDASDEFVTSPRDIAMLPGDDIYELIVVDAAKVRASCGDLQVFEWVGDGDMYRRGFALSFFASLIGFHPPPGLHAMRTEGRSMEPGIELDQWVLFLPAEHTRPRQVVSGQRYIFQTEDETTGDWGMSLKRLQLFSDGSVKIISDNPASGVEDEILVPAKRAKGEDGPGWLVQQRTGGRVRLHVMGRVLWPRDGEDSRETRTLSRMIETMAQMGYIRKAD